MLLSTSTWRALVPLVAAGAILLIVSVVLVGRDLAFARKGAELETLAHAEAGALALRFAPAAEVSSYLAGLLNHPAIATATVYSGSGERTTRTRPAERNPSSIGNYVPSLREPVVACRTFGSGTLCLEADRDYYGRRLEALLVPHAVLLSAAALLLLVAVLLGRAGNRRRLDGLTTIVRGASDESNYALRADESAGPMRALASAMNKLLEQMQQRDLMLRRRSTELETANRELEAFSYSVSHDLRSPLASVDGFSKALEDEYGERLDQSGREYLQWIRQSAEQMKDLVSGLLQISRLSRAEMDHGAVDLSEIACSIAQTLRQQDPSRTVDFRIEAALVAEGDERLLHAVLENLLSNAFKFTRKKENAVITVGSTVEGGRRTYFVRDNGAGFDSTQAAKMFTPFQRLHSASEFEGTGIGLATVKRIILRHGGAIWAEGQTGEGATFYFTLGDAPLPAEQKQPAELTRV